MAVSLRVHVFSIHFSYLDFYLRKNSKKNYLNLLVYTTVVLTKIIILTDNRRVVFILLPHINFRIVLFIITRNTCVSIKMYKVTKSLPSLLVFVTTSPSLRYPPFVYTQANIYANFFIPHTVHLNITTKPIFKFEKKK